MIADSQDLIAKPGRMAAQIFKTAPFTTKRNNPNVMIVIGSVRKTRIGQMTALASPITSAAIRAET